MDLDLGWRGLCVDAVLRLERFATRSCKKMQRVLFERSGERMHFQRYSGRHHAAYGGLRSDDYQNLTLQVTFHSREELFDDDLFTRRMFDTLAASGFEPGDMHEKVNLAVDSGGLELPEDPSAVSFPVVFDLNVKVKKKPAALQSTDSVLGDSIMVPIVTTSLADLMEEARMSGYHVPRVIDFLSIDV